VSDTYEHCRRALRAGKHVHVNKTMCTTVAEADELIDLARSNGLRLIASPGEVLRPQLRRARELIEEGAIWELAWAICGGSFESYHEHDEPERLDAPGGRTINPAWYFRRPGGGPLYDITDDNTVLLLDFGESRFAVVHGTAAGTISKQFGAGVYFGTRGTIEGVLLNGEPFDFPGRELTARPPVTDWDAQMHVLPHVVGRTGRSRSPTSSRTSCNSSTGLPTASPHR
jgi:hypothetical protein